MWKNQKEDELQLNLPKVTLPDPEKNYENFRVIENITMFFLESKELSKDNVKPSQPKVKPLPVSGYTPKSNEIESPLKSKRSILPKSNNFISDDSTFNSQKALSKEYLAITEEEENLIESMRELETQKIPFPAIHEVKFGEHNLFLPCNRPLTPSITTPSSLSPSLYLHLTIATHYISTKYPFSFQIITNRKAQNYFGLNHTNGSFKEVFGENELSKEFKINGILPGTQFLVADVGNEIKKNIRIFDYEDFTEDQLQEEFKYIAALNQLQEFNCPSLIGLHKSEIRLNFNFTTGLTRPCIVLNFDYFYLSFEDLIQFKIAIQNYWSREEWSRIAMELIQVMKYLEIWGLGFQMRDIYWREDGGVKVMPRNCSTEMTLILNCIAKAVFGGIPELYSFKLHDLIIELFTGWESKIPAPEPDFIESQQQKLETKDLRIPEAYENLGFHEKAVLEYTQFLNSTKVNEDEILEGEIRLGGCLLKLKRFEKAKLRFEKIQDKNPILKFLYGISLKSLGLCKEAIDACEAACIHLKKKDETNDLVFCRCLMLIGCLHLNGASTHSSLEMSFKCFSDALAGYKVYIRENWQRHTVARELVFLLADCSSKMENYGFSSQILSSSISPLALEESYLSSLDQSIFDKSMKFVANQDWNDKSIQEIAEKGKENLSIPTQASLAELIAFQHYKAGNYGESLKSYFQCLNLKSKLTHNSSIEGTLVCIGYLLVHFKQYDKAEKFFEKAHKIGISIYKSDFHPNLLPAILGLGTIYENWKKFDLASAMYRKALLSHSLFYGNKHFLYYIFKHNLARCNLYLKKYDEAFRLCEHALEGKIKANVPNESMICSLFLKVLISEKCGKKGIYINTLYLLLEKLEKSGLKMKMAEVLFRISGYHMLDGDIDSAFEAITKINDVNLITNKLIQAEIMGRQGELNALKGNKEEAERLLSKACWILGSEKDYPFPDYIIKIKGKLLALRFERKKKTNKNTDSDEEYSNHDQQTSNINTSKKFIYIDKVGP